MNTKRIIQFIQRHSISLMEDRVSQVKRFNFKWVWPFLEVYFSSAFVVHYLPCHY